jgi:hypothetical protein
VQAPVTGTIGLGPLGTLSQSKMDFVDAHAYWDHPQFPKGDWSTTNWLIKNKPMVDDPAGSPLWALAATRVAGKPFTITEYNHSAPNEWEAETIPMIATYAALQDWDAVFLFAYSHNDQFEKSHANGFFDIEGNWTKMAAMPLAARIFLGQGVKPLASVTRTAVAKSDMLRDASATYYEQWKFLSRHGKLGWEDAFKSRLSVDFGGVAEGSADDAAKPARAAWTATGAATGRFTLSDPAAAAFVGSKRPSPRSSSSRQTRPKH